MIAFKTIRARAAKRKGGDAALAALLPKVPSQKALARLADDRVLAEMAKRIFSAGFVWSVIEKKWPGFEAAFLGFEPARLLHQPDEFWEGLAGDKRIVRHPQKIMAVRDNARFVADIAREHGSFGKFLAQWPAGDQVGLLELLAKRGARLGGRTGPVLPALHRQGRLRHVGRRRRLPARCRPRHRGEPDLEEGPEEDPGRSSTPGRRRPGCRSPTSRASAPCRSARTTTPRRCAAAPRWTSEALHPAGRVMLIVRWWCLPRSQNQPLIGRERRLAHHGERHAQRAR